MLHVEADPPAELSDGLGDLVRAFPHRMRTAAAGEPATVRFTPDPGLVRGYATIADGAGWRIRYDRPCDAYRALGTLAGGNPHQAATSFETLGVMIDVSRNAVMRPTTIASLLRRYALMGVNQLWLYLEDTYTVPGEPLVGYARGRYTADELREIDDAAHRLGIEVVPCVQTLGHLEQVLQWPRYFALRDTDRVLLAGAPEAYDLIGRMLDAATSPLRSNRIHIGLDEAHGVGTGGYRRRFGDRPPFEILREHLDRVSALCADRGLRPMIWSDMYFRLGSATGDYYDPRTEIPAWVTESMPPGVQLVYWDYEHTDPAFYRDWIGRHRDALGGPPVFAAGVWTHHRMWAQLPRSLATITAGMAAARDCGLAEAVVTMWGNDGTEGDLYSALPGVQTFADAGYGNDPGATTNTAANLLGSAGICLDDWIAASAVDILPPVVPLPTEPAAAAWTGNAGKWLLWHDPVLSFLTAELPDGLAEHYRALADRLTAAADRNADDAPLAFPAALAAAVADKVVLHQRTGPAYRRGDRDEIREITETLLPRLVERIRRLHAIHRDTWHARNKPFGWDVIDRRYGGLQARLDHLDRLLRGWLDDPTRPIEELTEPPQVAIPEGAHTRCLTHARVASPSFIH
ncbi:MAG: beta-N-acetylhexosaminidase [Hamadaea sp.]|nr:beta-N-acetylhexosaminidase [Hamadaea sp.]NUT04315.1 beta-N-acetylhexosaminidase [Hamadaea sp.]